MEKYVVGDVVVVRKMSPRNAWPIVLVTAVKTNADVVMSVTLKLKPTAMGQERIVRMGSS